MIKTSDDNIKLHIYDYKLSGYSNDATAFNPEEYKTLSIDDVATGKCGIVEVIDVVTPSENIIRSCDVISSKMQCVLNNDIVSKPNQIEEHSNIYFELVNDKIKITVNDLLNFINVNGSKKKLLKTMDLQNIPQNILNVYEYANISCILKNVSCIMELEYPRYERYKKDIEKITYVKWLQIKEEESIVLFGDVHGSLATIVRHLCRLKKQNIIDRNGIIKDGYRIIFLGDLVDRGLYAYEVLVIVYLLKIINNDKFILNRGNHEEMRTNKLHGLKNEICHKLIHNDHRCDKKCTEIYELINNVMLLQPSSVIIENPISDKKYVYLAHGGLPHDLEDNNVLPGDFIRGVNSKKSFIIDDEYGTSMRWNDIHGLKKTEDSNRCSDGDPCIKVIGTNVINSARNIGIELVIRGHQDSYYNTKLIHENTHDWVDIKNYTQGVEKRRNKTCTGSICEISIKKRELYINDDGKHLDFLPAVCISTNTDTGRDLTSDSCAILRFNNDPYKDNCRTHTGGSKEKKKFYKYMEKLFELFAES